MSAHLTARPARNLLLSALPPREREQLEPLLEPVSLVSREILQDVDARLDSVWFPRSGVLSMVSQMEDGSVVEVATVGREGMVGVPLVLGSTQSAHCIFAQVPGGAYRLPAASFTRLIDELPVLRNLALRYALALIAQISQGSACNRLHPVEARCARWLLMTHDRVDADSFPMTQEYLGQMLGVTRPSVSVAAGMLQKAGLISYVRGTVTILNREALEAASCECYNIIAREFARLIEDAGSDIASRQSNKAANA